MFPDCVDIRNSNVFCANPRYPRVFIRRWPASATKSPRADFDKAGSLCPRFVGQSSGGTLANSDRRFVPVRAFHRSLLAVIKHRHPRMVLVPRRRLFNSGPREGSVDSGRQHWSFVHECRVHLHQRSPRLQALLCIFWRFDSPGAYQRQTVTHPGLEPAQHS